MRGESEGYVVECCVRSLERVCEAVVRSCVAWLGGSDECRRIERMGGRIWCSYQWIQINPSIETGAKMTYIWLDEERVVVHNRAGDI